SPIPGPALKEQISTDPWHMDESMEETTIFMRGCKEYFEQDPDPFYLLGYELGAWLYAGCKRIEEVDGWGDMATRIETFGKVDLVTPRGAFSYHEPLQLMTPPVSITEQKQGEAPRIVSTVPSMEVITPDHSDLDPIQVDHKARFINPYMVI
ncbi:MAG TPA: hypothetical protein DCP28_09720, partial [Cytophagales bacterium]|nr:hypothetical protein [Cytophagales bacterium]